MAIAATSASAVPWGVTAQTGVLTDVLLGKPDHFRWVPLNSISAVTLANTEQMGHRFDQQKAMRQHRQMVDVYEPNGVRCIWSRRTRACRRRSSRAIRAS